MLAMQGAIASKRALAPEERPKRLREGWASRSDVRMARGACDAQGCANGAGRMDAPEAYPLSPIRYPLLSSMRRIVARVPCASVHFCADRADIRCLEHT